MSSERIKFIPEKGEGLGLDFPRADYKVIGGARGYPRVLITQVSSGNQYTILYRSGAGVTKKYNDGPGETVAMLDAAPLLEALGGSFQPLAARLLPKPALLIASKPAGAEIFLDAKSMGKTDTQGSLKLENLVPGSYQVRASAAGHQDWSQSLVLDSGERKELNVQMAALPPPPPPKPQGKNPLTIEEVVQLLDGKVTPGRVGNLVREFGVDFLLSDDKETRLRQAGADDPLLMTIAKNKK